MATAPEKTDAADDAVASGRVNVTIPYRQNVALDQMAKATGLSRAELVRQAVALLNVAYRARAKDLDVAIVNNEDRVVAHITQTL